MGKNTLITGRPGIGKSSVLLKSVDILKDVGFKIGGMISHEIREQGLRKGFRIVDLNTGTKGLLAHMNQVSGPKIGKYRVNLVDLKNIGANSILEAIKKADIIVIDEIGPMELYSSEFRDAVKKAIINKKPIIGTIHHRVHDPLIKTIKTNDDTEILEITLNNREKIPFFIVQQVINFYK